MTAAKAETGQHSENRPSYGFCGYVLDPVGGGLFKDGRRIPLRNKSFEMLCLFAARPGELLTRDELMAEIWGGTIVTENSVTQCLKEIRQAIGDTELSIIRTVPRRGYVFDAPVTALTGNDKPQTAAPGSRTTRVVVAMLSLAVVGLAWWLMTKPGPAGTSGGEATAHELSIAVLPFVNMSADPDISYLAAGISEQILNELAQIPELLVIARTSSFSFRDHEATVADIAEQLNVAYVLEGSVRVDGDRARVTVQLIETGDQSHRWSHTFEREFAYIFALQDEIALAVAEKLQVSLLDDAPGVRDADPEAYVLYLQAQELFYKQSGADDFERSGSLYRRAIEIDPDFVDAISGYARYLWISGETLPGEDSNRARIRRMVDRALAVEPTHPMLLSWRSFFAMVIDNDLDTAARHLERAFESNPTDYQLLWSSILTLPGFGRSDLAAQVGEYLLERDPLCHLCRDATARAHRNLGNFERALELLNTGMALHSDWFAGQFGRTLALVYAGRPEEALQNAIELELQVEEAHPEFAGTTPGHLEALHDLGMMEKFNARLPQYIEMHTADHAGYVAQLYAWIGDADRAFEWLDRIDTTDSYAIRSQLARFGYRSLREDPRMQAVLERYQLTDAQIEAVGLELRLPGGSQQETLGSQ